MLSTTADCTSAIIGNSAETCYSLGYSFGLYFRSLVSAWKENARKRYAAPMGAVCKRLVRATRSAAALLKNEPPYFFFAADLAALGYE